MTVLPISMSQFSSRLISPSHTTFQRRAAPEQGGLLTGKDPTQFNLADPLRLWIIQVGIIIITTQVLSLGLRKLRQPRVIAEILGGILLGPTAFGRIPGFSKHIFPSQSIPFLSLVANIGLCLYLFLIGLETDTAIIRRNARLSATVAAAGIVIPFGFGAALAIPLYKHFIDSSQVTYTHFMLFTGVAYSITAFPVLCRILTELKLLDTTVGIVVLSAGVGNDIMGWTLLALSVALVNAGSGLTALWILLVCIGWALFLFLLVSRMLFWVARNTGSIENGPTMFFMTIATLILFGSAFFTDVIGVHAIFGAFLAGITVPREGGLAVALTEKLEDMVTVIFLPLYFTLSGLSTNLGLLNTGTIWGFTIAICVLAFAGKFGGCTMAARYAGFNWREASTIGSLMSCKGLIELIVLNVGLSAGILTTRVFSMFVLEALLLTFATTPTVSFLYPPHLHTQATVTDGIGEMAQGGQGSNKEEA
ncbi:Sodium/hydrogen exchanger [Lactifluus subvellereus]|nr:Sodium/hydrogen exchanger [Lactifluus subvellereus]